MKKDKKDTFLDAVGEVDDKTVTEYQKAKAAKGKLTRCITSPDTDAVCYTNSLTTE